MPLAAALLLLSGARFTHAVLTMPPPIPATWPANDQQVMITGALLTAPLITEALAHVESIVPASLLNIKVATFVTGSTVTYNDVAASACYWPATQCVRTTATSSYAPDIVACPAANTWGITFDDGPTATANHVADTAAIRTALDGVGAKATFFACGTSSQANPSELLASYNAGHQIAVHTWTHHPLTSLTNAQVVAELKYTEAMIYSITGKVPTFFRPPYGDIDDRVRAIAGALGYRTVIWAIDSEDASMAVSAANSALVRATIKSWGVPRPGFVSLQHDISTFTSQIAVDALGDIKALGSAYPLIIQSVSQCTGFSPYWDGVSAVGVPSGSGSSGGGAASVVSSAASAAASAASAVVSSAAAVVTGGGGGASTSTKGGVSTTSTGKGADAGKNTAPSTTQTSTSSSAATATHKATETVVQSGAQGLYSWVSSLVVAAIVALGLPLI
ncbi:chitin deacetylase [Geranomyces variabilis]|uniref:Chitin deacetylase n=1 Tax=Geranomyces variabilis TaxID=109894 RepID=A0AAD5XL38_9FUNG|nr:chitin deacetylase [Geranomyces variabilis]